MLIMGLKGLNKNSISIYLSFIHMCPVAAFVLPQVLILFTDGFQTRREELNPAENAKKLKDKNVTIFAVGAGAPDPIELFQISSGFRYVKQVRSVSQLSEAVDKLVNEICKIQVMVSTKGSFFREFEFEVSSQEFTRVRVNKNIKVTNE